MRDSPRILIVEDDPVIGNALTEGLGREGLQTWLITNGGQALASFRSQRPDLLLLDIMLPDVDGFTLCGNIRELDAQVPIIMLTARDAVADRVQGLKSGADDYITKPFSFEELVARIHALWRRTRRENTSPLRFLHLSLDPSSMELRVGTRRELLTVRECAVLEFLMRHPNQVLTRAEIYEGAWDQTYTGRSNMVDVYINYLRNRTQAEGEPKVIHTIRGKGYILREPGDSD